ncbi:MAG: hypothetical protein ACKOAX_06460, partial [Candidatus Kapaibacterium sp.]
DLTKMEVVDMPQIRGVTDNIQNIVSAWRENGKSYVVIYQYLDADYDPRADWFILYEFSIDSARRVHYNPLDTTPFGIWPRGSTPYYSYRSSFVWHSRDGKEHTLVVDLESGQSDFYSIKGGKLVFAHRIHTPLGLSWPGLQYGISSLQTNGYARSKRTNVFLYDGNPAVDSTPKARFPTYYKGEPFIAISSCGDVNNDGHGDIGVIYNPGTLVVYAGLDSLVTSVAAPGESPIGLEIVGEHPAKHLVTMRLQIDRPAVYTVQLYSLTGERLSTLVEEQLSSGTYLRSFDAAAANLPSGLYNLRLSDDARVVDKGILIQR